MAELVEGAPNNEQLQRILALAADLAGRRAAADPAPPRLPLADHLAHFDQQIAALKTVRPDEVPDYPDQPAAVTAMERMRRELTELQIREAEQRRYILQLEAALDILLHETSLDTSAGQPPAAGQAAYFPEPGNPIR